MSDNLFSVEKVNFVFNGAKVNGRLYHGKYFLGRELEEMDGVDSHDVIFVTAEKILPDNFQILQDENTYDYLYIFKPGSACYSNIYQAYIRSRVHDAKIFLNKMANIPSEIWTGDEKKAVADNTKKLKDWEREMGKFDRV